MPRRPVKSVPKTGAGTDQGRKCRASLPRLAGTTLIRPGKRADGLPVGWARQCWPVACEVAHFLCSNVCRPGSAHVGASCSILQHPAQCSASVDCKRRRNPLAAPHRDSGTGRRVLGSTCSRSLAGRHPEAGRHNGPNLEITISLDRKLTNCPIEHSPRSSEPQQIPLIAVLVHEIGTWHKHGTSSHNG